jgi:hypothetical protein
MGVEPLCRRLTGTSRSDWSTDGTFRPEAWASLAIMTTPSLVDRPTPAIQAVS